MYDEKVAIWASDTSIKEDEALYIEQNYKKGEEAPNLFAFFRRQEEVISVHYIHESGLDLTFTIKRGFRMPPEDEETFLLILLDPTTQIKADVLTDLSGLQANLEWNLNLPRNIDSRKRLIHIYFASHPGLLEILFKCKGIQSIAQSAVDNRILDLKEGENVEEILGVHLTMLRALAKEGIEILRTPEQRSYANQIYQRYHGFIHGDDPLSLSQIEYLLYSSEVRPKVFRELQSYTAQEKILLSDYLSKREIVCDYYSMLPLAVPRSKLKYYQELVSYIVGLIVNEEMLNTVLEKRLASINVELKGNVHVLRSVEQFISIASCFRNCMYTYVTRVCYEKNSLIAVVGDCLCVEIGVEIEETGRVRLYLRQALGRNNRTPNKKEMYILGQFLEENNIEYL